MMASQFPVAMRLKSFRRFLRLKILPTGDQDVRARIQCEQLGRELAEHVVGHGEHGLARQSQPFQFHRRGNHCVGLARADNVAQQRVGGLQDAPDARLLMQLQLNRRACARQRQVFTIERAQSRVIERVIVKPHEPLAPLVIRPNPFFESFLDALLFFAAASVAVGLTTGFLSFVS